MTYSVINSRKALRYARPHVRRQASFRGSSPSATDPVGFCQDAHIACTWTPLPGPQTQAYQSLAKWIGYGGAAAGGKTDLLLGLAGTKHRRSLIVRRLFPSMHGMIDRSREIFQASVSDRWKDRYNEGLHRWRLANGRLVQFGNVQFDKEWEKYRGNPYDLHAFDEATEFSELVVRSITGWNRTSTPGQHCQVLLTFNPPSDEAGRWVIRFFLPWMAYLYPDLEECKRYTGVPAAPGELRFFTTVDGVETEVPAGTPRAESRTFFPAKVEDNPISMAQGYDAVLEAMPEPLRSQLRYGDFGAGVGTDPWQVIPSAWIRAAMDRWSPRSRPGPLSGVGVDVARGGRDWTQIARRHGAWFAPLDAHPGSDTPNGPVVASLVVAGMGGQIADEPQIAIDVIGVGAAVYDAMPVPSIGVNVGAAAPDGATDRSGVLTFGNMRAYLWWRMRENLDPASGDDLALPDDDQLRAELASPRFFIRAGRIWVEDKDEIRKRLGRSTDRADAVLLANYPESRMRLRWL